MRRIKLNYSNIEYKKDEKGDFIFDEKGNGIVEKKETIEFNLTLKIDENITAEETQKITKLYQDRKEGKEMEMFIDILNSIAIEKENIELIRKISMKEFIKLGEFIAESFNKVFEIGQKKMTK